MTVVFMREDQRSYSSSNSEIITYLLYVYIISYIHIGNKQFYKFPSHKVLPPTFKGELAPVRSRLNVSHPFRSFRLVEHNVILGSLCLYATALLRLCERVGFSYKTLKLIRLVPNLRRGVVDIITARHHYSVWGVPHYTRFSRQEERTIFPSEPCVIGGRTWSFRLPYLLFGKFINCVVIGLMTNDFTVIDNVGNEGSNSVCVD